MQVCRAVLLWDYANVFVLSIHLRLWAALQTYAHDGEVLKPCAYLQVATPVQQARCEVLAFPWTPDVLAICNLLAAERDRLQAALAGPPRRAPLHVSHVLDPLTLAPIELEVGK